MINWNPHLVNVNKDITECVEYMHSKGHLQLCYTPVYNIIPVLTCFSNTRSLHNNINVNLIFWVKLLIERGIHMAE